MIREGLVQARNNGCYIYGLRSGDKVVVFDGGIDDEGHALDALLGKMGASRDEVTDVFLTHGHFDHVALVPLCGKARIRLGDGDTEMAAQKAPQEPRGARWFSKLGTFPAIRTTDPPAFHQGKPGRHLIIF
jgi:glyoxylase-like metal-dependent hydrolase (beta-lactamase superfamily II)